jgi:DNA-binding GntR family transcriptional regulator
VVTVLLTVLSLCYRFIGQKKLPPFLDMRSKHISSAKRAEIYLRRAILAGKLQPRQRIIERDVANELTMSRGPVREALLRLERDGLVVTTLRHGTFIRDVSPSEIGIIFRMRARLEGLCVRYMRENQSVDPPSLLSDALKNLLEAKDNEEKFVRADMGLHRIIWKAAGQPTLYRTLDGLMNPYILVIASSYSSRIPLADRRASHEQYVRLVLETSVTRIERKVEEYFEKLYQFVFEANSRLRLFDNSDRPYKELHQHP